MKPVVGVPTPDAYLPRPLVGLLVAARPVHAPTAARQSPAVAANVPALTALQFRLSRLALSISGRRVHRRRTLSFSTPRRRSLGACVHCATASVFFHLSRTTSSRCRLPWPTLSSPSPCVISFLALPVLATPVPTVLAPARERHHL
jgi:hypothetical protein|uniref:Uncharacterized protein n=1 Tax=Zea mays TaxID=4577 RepID=C0P3E9_MAIZE|nr:unknown [Zea mays]